MRTSSKYALFDPLSSPVYFLLTICSFLSGCVPALFILAAGAFGGPGRFWLVTFAAIVTFWAVGYLLPLLFIASDRSFPLLYALLSSTVAVLYCGYTTAVTFPNRADGLTQIGPIAAPFWVWLLISTLLNVVQASFSFLRLRQLRTLR